MATDRRSLRTKPYVTLMLQGHGVRSFVCFTHQTAISVLCHKFHRALRAYFSVDTPRVSNA